MTMDSDNGRVDRYKETSSAYMRDVKKYLDEVRGNKRYFTPQANWKPRFSEAHEQGYFKNPPTDKQYVQGYPEPPAKDSSLLGKTRSMLQGLTKTEIPLFSAPLDAVLRGNVVNDYIKPGAQKLYGALHDPRLEALGAGAGAVGRMAGTAERLGQGAMGVLRGERGSIPAFSEKKLLESGGMRVPMERLVEQDKEMAFPTASDYYFGRKVDASLAHDELYDIGEAREKFRMLDAPGQARIKQVQEEQIAAQRRQDQAVHMPELGGGSPPPAINPEAYRQIWPPKK